jgi:hypothetical protein
MIVSLKNTAENNDVPNPMSNSQIEEKVKDIMMTMKDDKYEEIEK